MADDAGHNDSGPLALAARDPQVFVEALQRVLDSETFRSAPKSRDLLSYVVSETIAGRGPKLKERMIARVALGRPSTIDTRTDASGRVHTSRVRERLARYYAREGADDPIRISIPVGQYAAAFEA